MNILVVNRYQASNSPIIDDLIDNHKPVDVPINEYHIPNAYIGYYGYITKCFKNIEEIVSPRHYNFIRLSSVLSNYFLKKKIKIKRPAISITHGWYDNFYHFSQECIFKLFLLKDYLPTSTLILPSKLSNFHKEWLNLFEIDEVIYLNENEIIDTPLAISCNFPNRDLNFHSEWLNDFRYWVLNKVKSSKVEGPKNIFIGRPKNSKRNIVNTNEVLFETVKYGYEYVEMEDYSLNEQINLFNNADKIIAVHGAALSNLMFCKPNTKIIELTNVNYDVYCFYKLSKILNLNYQMLRCEDEIGENSNFGYRDFKVDINELEKTILKNEN